MSTQRWTLVAVCAATFMLLSASLATPPALPHIQRELSATFSQLQWVPNAFLVMQASLLLTAGSLADRNGRRRFFLIGTTIFAIGELACGLSRSPTTLDLSSGLAGAGSELVFGPSLALFTTAFLGPARAAAFSAWGTSGAMSYALALVLGGAPSRRSDGGPSCSCSFPSRSRRSP